MSWAQRQYEKHQASRDALHEQIKREHEAEKYVAARYGLADVIGPFLAFLAVFCFTLAPFLRAAAVTWPYPAEVPLWGVAIVFGLPLLAGAWAAYVVIRMIVR